MIKTKEREKDRVYYQQFTTDELLLQLSDWLALRDMFGEDAHFRRHIEYIEDILTARVNQNHNL